MTHHSKFIFGTQCQKETVGVGLHSLEADTLFFSPSGKLCGQWFKLGFFTENLDYNLNPIGATNTLAV